MGNNKHLSFLNDPDIIGQAGIDYWNNKVPKDVEIKVWSDIAEIDVLPVNYLFRSFHEMPCLEQKALMLSRGEILDVGAGMGSHALYLQNKGKNVTAMDISPLACEVMRTRKIKKVINDNFFSWEGQQKFDTILMLMNGIGICGTIQGLELFFDIARKLLKTDGQIIMDSSDLRYLFNEDSSNILSKLNKKYYGEVLYRMSYNGVTGKKFPWLFIDDELMKYYAEKNGFKFEKIAEGTHYDYLGRLCVTS